VAHPGVLVLRNLATKQPLLVSWRCRHIQPNSYALHGFNLASLGLDAGCETGWAGKTTNHALTIFNFGVQKTVYNW
jgi:hypothetical protein